MSTFMSVLQFSNKISTEAALATETIIAHAFSRSVGVDQFFVMAYVTVNLNRKAALKKNQDIGVPRIYLVIS